MSRLQPEFAVGTLDGEIEHYKEVPIGRDLAIPFECPAIMEDWSLVQAAFAKDLVRYRIYPCELSVSFLLSCRLFVTQERRKAITSLVKARVTNIPVPSCRLSRLADLLSLVEISTQLLYSPEDIRSFWKHVLLELPLAKSSPILSCRENVLREIMKWYRALPKFRRRLFISLLAAGADVSESVLRCKDTHADPEKYRRVLKLINAQERCELPPKTYRRAVIEWASELEDFVCQLQQVWQSYEELCRKYPIFVKCPLLAAHLLANDTREERLPVEVYVRSIWNDLSKMRLAKRVRWTRSFMNQCFEESTLFGICMIYAFASRSRQVHPWGASKFNDIWLFIAKSLGRRPILPDDNERLTVKNFVAAVTK